MKLRPGPEKIKPRDWFKQNIFAEAYSAAKEGAADSGLEKLEWAQVYTKALAKSYNELIRDKVLTNVYHIVPDDTNKDLCTKIARKKDFQQAVIEYLKNLPDEDHPHAFDDLRNAAAEYVNNEIMEMEHEH